MSVGKLKRVLLTAVFCMSVHSGRLAPVPDFPPPQDKPKEFKMTHDLRPMTQDGMLIVKYYPEFEIE